MTAKFNDYDMLVMHVDRSDIERANPDIKPWEDFKRIVAATPLNGPKFTLVFGGYDDDPREVWQIDAIRAHCLRIMRECPKFYLLSDDITKGMLIYCTANKLDTGERVPNPEWSVVEPEINTIQLATQW